MKAIIVILILCSFLQSTILSLDLVTVILLIRTFITKDRANLYSGFFLGLLVSHLSFTPLGLQSLIYLLMIELTIIISKIRFWNTTLTFIPLLIIMLCLNQIIIAWVTNQTIILWPKIGWDLLIAIPIYILLRLWEERFVVRPEVKLRV